MTDLIAMTNRYPRLRYLRQYTGPAKHIGLLVDWISSRPEHRTRDARALWRKIEKGDLDAKAAAAILGMIEPWEASMLVEFPRAYRVYFHDQIADHLEADEIAFGEQTYRRLHDLEPDCVSALVNLAELERRGGHETNAHDLLHSALHFATTGKAKRYGLEDSTWEPPIRCALARLVREVGEGASFLEAARSEQLSELAAVFNNLERTMEAVIPIHQAFSVASAEQRIAIHAAMKLAGIWPGISPAAHGDFAATLAVEELVRQHEEKDNDPKKVRYLFGPPVQQPPNLSSWKRLSETAITTPVLIVLFVIMLAFMVIESLLNLVLRLLINLHLIPKSLTKANQIIARGVEWTSESKLSLSFMFWTGRPSTIWITWLLVVVVVLTIAGRRL